MRLLAVLGAPVLALAVASSAAALEVCLEFFEHHIGDPIWTQQCLEELEREYPPTSPVTAPTTSSGASSAMASSTPTVAAPVNVSASNLLLAGGNQREPFIALDPTDTSRVFYIAMAEPVSNGLFAARSVDGGVSWAPTIIAVGPGGPIPAGRADPWAVFSGTGRLFISYDFDFFIDDSNSFDIPAGSAPVVVAESKDGGATFEYVEALSPSSVGDRSSLATGPPGEANADGSLWVLFVNGTAGTIEVRGAALDASGDPILDFCGSGTGHFCYGQTIAVKRPDEFIFPGHIAVGPSGQVLATFTRNPADGSPPLVDLYVVRDPDGLGPQPFVDLGPVLATSVKNHQRIPPQDLQGIQPLANLAWDQTSGRVYLVSTVQNGATDETDIVLLYSDDAGTSWNGPNPVNDDVSPPGEVRSQFFPHVAVDQTSGTVAVAWYDPRNDDGGADGVANTETEVYVGISDDGGDSFQNLPVSAGFSRAIDFETHHGDYLGLAFHDGALHAAWVDNSNSTLDNPDAGTPPGCDPVLCMDPYTATVEVPEPGSLASLLAGGLLLGRLGVRRRGR